MAHSPAPVTTYGSQHAEPPSSRREERGAPLAATVQLPDSTNVVIPSSLLDSITSGPYISGATQDAREEVLISKDDFDVRRIAQQLQEETTRILVRSTSVSTGALERSGAAGKDTKTDESLASGAVSQYRKTSLDPNFGSGLRSRLSPDAGRYYLPTVTEGQIETQAKSGTSRQDYFGDYAFGQRTPVLAQSGFGETHPRAEVLHERSPSSASPTRWGSRNFSHDIQITRTSTQRSRHTTAPGSRKGSIIQRSASIVLDTVHNVKETVRRSSIYDAYEKAKKRGLELQRSKWAMLIFEWTFYLILISFVYFVLIGLPLWKGAVYWLYWVFDHKFAVAGTWSVTIGIAFIYAYAPLFIFFEKDPPMPADLDHIDPTKTPGVHNTALMIPCYKSAKIIGPTLEAAIKIFPPSHIFVIANGNSPTPLDDTELVCRPYGVNHVWSPVGSKIVAQFVGCYAARGFKNVLLIDDDCALPPNFPIVSDRMTKTIKCIGYTIKSVGPESSAGTLCQQAQDLEYKLSGIQRALAGVIGSATFPHGAISLWDRDFLIQTFHQHPGFSVSEDWFFGHVARQLGSRITMCTSVFIETETPSAVFFSSGGVRGGFGEMTIYKQRFLRWNFFFVNGMYYNMAYILGSWKLGFWELGAKLFVFQEVYETLLYLLTPFVLPISIIVRPDFFGYLFAGTFVLYFLNVVIFNEVHLRLKKERVSSMMLYVYYMPYKVVLTLINVGSCYWSLYKYARYFARRHPKIVEDEKAVDVVLKMEETREANTNQGRRMTVTAVGAQVQGSIVEQTADGPSERKMTVTTLGPRLDADPMSPVPEDVEHMGPAIRLQGERVSFDSSRRSTESSMRIERLPRYPSEQESPGGQLHGVSGSSVKNPLGLARSRSGESPGDVEVRSTGRGSRRSESTRRSGSLRRSGSFGRQQQQMDIATPGFEELMDRLATIEERLNNRDIQAVEVTFEERKVPVIPGLPFQTSPVRGVEVEAADDHDLYGLDDLEKEETRKTSESKSMV